MTSTPVQLLRRGRLWALLAATGLAIAGIAGAGSASAGNAPQPPTYSFSSAVSAVGVQVALQRNPDFSSLPDPFDEETPDSEAQLNSFGTSVADGHIVNLNGFGSIPGLICLASGQCASIPIGQLTAGLIPAFPPPDPIDAHATYPHVPTAGAPVIGSKTAELAVDAGGFALDAGAANATADQYANTTSVRAQNLSIPGGLTIGSSTTRTMQSATADALTTTAETHLSNVAIGGTALTIGSITTTTTVVSKPGKPATDTTSTQLSGVKSAGLNATIDGSGIHINGNALPGNVVAQVQDAVNKTFAAAGIKVALQKVTRADDPTGHRVAAYGLLITYDHTLNNPPPLDSVTVSPKSLNLPCPIHLPVGVPDPCSGVSFTFNGVYHGQVALGQVGVVSLAQPGFNGGAITPPGSTTPPAVTTPPGGTGTGPSAAPLPPTTQGQQGSGAGAPPPEVATGQRAVADQLGGVSRRLEWFFPLFALGVFALIGRLRVPARLPGPK